MIQLELQRETEAQLTAEAQSQGITIESYVQRILSSYSSDQDQLKEGLEDIASAKTVSARTFFAELHEEYGIRG